MLTVTACLPGGHTSGKIALKSMHAQQRPDRGIGIIVICIAQVYLARCKPLNTMVAVKLVDLEELSASLDLLIKEAQTMKSLRHPNVLPLHCSFMADSALWLVMPYIGGGNVSELLRSQVQRLICVDMRTVVGCLFVGSEMCL